MIWFTSDTHFFHRNVIDYCKRPWTSVEEMNEGLIANWNAKVKKKERVYVLGDLCFGGGERLRGIVARLNGEIVVVKGNHDPSARKLIAAGVHDVVENEILKLPNGEKVLLSHFPYFPTEFEQEEASEAGIELDRRYLYKRIYSHAFAAGWLLHGHVHQAWKVHDRQLNVGVDVWDWSPVAHETIQSIIKG